MKFTRSAVAMLQSPPETDQLSKQQTLDFEILYLIETEPGLTQRQLADRAGISLGRVNFCLRALAEKGALKLANFRASDERWRYVYVLTPQGIAHRIALTGQFLNRKMAEFDRLKAQIERLQVEDDSASD